MWWLRRGITRNTYQFVWWPWRPRRRVAVVVLQHLLATSSVSAEHPCSRDPVLSFLPFWRLIHNALQSLSFFFCRLSFYALLVFLFFFMPNDTGAPLAALPKLRYCRARFGEPIFLIFCSPYFVRMRATRSPNDLIIIPSL